MTHQLRSNHLILLGDTHGIQPTIWDVQNNIPEGADVCHVGDFGAGFGDEDHLRIDKLNDECKAKDIRMYIIRGNHDDPGYWPLTKSNVLLIEDYTYLKFENGMTALCVGGAISIDRSCSHRVEGRSYWKDEVTVFEPGLCEKCDIVIMHDAPTYFNHPCKSLLHDWIGLCDQDDNLFDDVKAQRECMDRILEIAKPDRVYGGHFHDVCHGERDGMIYRCLAERELLEIRVDV
jgi:hypothetical protein